MSVVLLFTLVCAGGLAASVLIVALLRSSLRRILVDLCSGEHRAGFWVSVTGVWIVLVGLLAGSSTFGYWSGDGTTDLFSGATTQVRLLLVGLLGAVGSVALVLLSAIRRQSARDDRRPARLRPAAPPVAWQPQAPAVPPPPPAV